MSKQKEKPKSLGRKGRESGRSGKEKEGRERETES